MLRPPVTLRRVLMTCDAVGGVWRYAVDLAKALRADGIATLLVGFGPEPELGDGGELDGIALEWSPLPPLWMAERPEDLVGAPAALAALERAFGAQLVHLNQLSEAAGAAFAAPVVAAAHSCLATWWRAMEGGAPPDEWAWKIARERAGLLRADAVLAPSCSHAAALRRAYGVVRRIHVAPNACAAPPQPREKAPLVLAAGRWWDPAKNLAVIDAAAARCRWPVTVCGALDGPEGSRAEVRHARHGGQRDRAAMDTLMGEAAIFVSASRYEPFGLAALEAAHAGAALVLSDIPTYRELWDGAADFFDARDPAALAARLNGLGADAPRRRALGAAARQRAAGYGLERQATAVRSAYDDAMAGRGATAPALDVAG